MPLIRVNPVGEASSSSAQSTKFITLSPPAAGTQRIATSDPIPVQGLPTIAITYRMLSGVLQNEKYMVFAKLQGAIVEDPFNAANGLYFFNLSNAMVLVNGAGIDGLLGGNNEVEQIITTTHALAYIRVQIQIVDPVKVDGETVQMECHLSISQ